jgi:hypothetical protein
MLVAMPRWREFKSADDFVCMATRWVLAGDRFRLCIKIQINFAFLHDLRRKGEKFHQPNANIFSLSIKFYFAARYPMGSSSTKSARARMVSGEAIFGRSLNQANRLTINTLQIR